MSRTNEEQIKNCYLTDGFALKRDLVQAMWSLIHSAACKGEPHKVVTVMGIKNKLKK